MSSPPVRTSPPSRALPPVADETRLRPPRAPDAANRDRVVPDRSQRKLPAAPGLAPHRAAPSDESGAPSLTTTLIEVHGVSMKVQLDPNVATMADVRIVEQALGRYPASWFRGAVNAAARNHERLPVLRMVDQAAMPGRSAAEGQYDAQANAIALNMAKVNDPTFDTPLKDIHGRTLRGHALLARTAIHELAHFIDDAGTPDTSPIDRMASFYGPAQPPRGPGMPAVRAHGRGAFRQGVIARNLSTPSSEHYASEYDQARNEGRGFLTTAEEETFAEIVTEAVYRGDARRAELETDGRLGTLARSVYGYLDHECDPRWLTTGGVRVESRSGPK